MSWFVLSVEKNHENRVEKTFNKIGIEVFNPTVKGTKYWGDRQKEIRTPLFKSYIFVRMQEKYRGLIFGISGVKGYLFLDGKPTLLTNKEINDIRQLLSEDNYGLLMLSKLIEGKEIDIENWFSKSNSGVKWIGKTYTSQLTDKMDRILKEKFREVV